MANARMTATVTSTWHVENVLAKVQAEMTHRMDAALDKLEVQVRGNLRDPDRRGAGFGGKTEPREDDSQTVGIRTLGLESGGSKSRQRFGGAQSPGLIVNRTKLVGGHLVAGVGFIKGDKLAAILELGLAGSRAFRPLSNARGQAWHVMKQVMGIR